MPSKGTISEQLAEYVTGMTIGDLPAEVVDKTKLCILDTIGCMLAGSRDEVGIRITAHALRHGPPGPCTVFGHPKTVGPEHAALANGTTAHVLEWDDGHRPSDNHIAGAVVPAALAVAQTTQASGAELILSVTLGYDVMGRVGEAVCLPRQGQFFHGNGTCGVFGAAAAAGKLLGLDAGQLANALGIAGDGASGLREFRPTGADCKPLHVGRAAQTGITAAFLAAEGFNGSATILEGQYGFCGAMTPAARPELICVELGRRFAVLESGFKVHACVGTLALPVDAALWLRKTHGLDPASIQRIRVALPDSIRDDHLRRRRPPPDVGNARFSISFTVAAAFRDGEVTHRQISRAGLADLGIARLEALVEYVSDPEVEQIYAAQKSDEPFFFSPCIVEVDCGGRSYLRLERTPMGYDPQQRGLTAEQVVAKFRSAAGQVLGMNSTEAVIEWALGLDRESRAGNFAALLEQATISAV
jgi:2-methylcitrate dehydratase PrpD